MSGQQNTRFVPRNTNVDFLWEVCVFTVGDPHMQWKLGTNGRGKEHILGHDDCPMLPFEQVLFDIASEFHKVCRPKL